MGKPCWYNMLGRRGGVSPEIPDLAAHQDERGQMTVGGWRVGVGGDVDVSCDLLMLLMLCHAGVGVGGMLTFHVTCSRC